VRAHAVHKRLPEYNKRSISPVSGLGLITHTTEPCLARAHVIFGALTLRIRNAAFAGNANNGAFAGVPQVATKSLELLLSRRDGVGSKHDGATFAKAR
jgi:hypothetical protein